MTGKPSTSRRRSRAMPAAATLLILFVALAPCTASASASTADATSSSSTWKEFTAATRNTGSGAQKSVDKHRGKEGSEKRRNPFGQWRRNRFANDNDNKKKEEEETAKEEETAIGAQKSNSSEAADADNVKDGETADVPTDEKEEEGKEKSADYASNKKDDDTSAVVPPFSQPQFPPSAAANQTATAQPSSSSRGAIYILPRSSRPSGIMSPGQGVGIFGPPTGRGSLHSHPGLLPGSTAPSEGGAASVSATLLVPLLSALTKLLIASLLTPGGPRKNPILSLFFRDKAYLPDPVQKYTFERINDRYERDGAALKRALLEQRSASEQIGHFWRWRGHNLGRKMKRSNNITDTGSPAQMGQKGRTVIVVDFITNPGSAAAHFSSPHSTPLPSGAPKDPIELLRDQISFVMQQYNDPSLRPLFGSEVEILLLVESGGGGVQDYGIAADAVRRIRHASGPSSSDDVSDETRSLESNDDKGKETEILLTVCVDRVAASGGYMVASQATPGRLFAAPFALLGSIGVYTERINIHDMLDRLGVRGLVLKAGSSKAPIGTIGEIEPKDVEGVEQDLKRVHDAFRGLVKDSRRVELGDTIGEVMEGEVYLGQQAKDLGLVDRITTSDEYIAERVQAGDRVLRLRRYDKPKFGGLGLSPLDLLLSDGGPGGLLGRWKSKISTALSAANVMDGVKVVGMIAGIFTLLKDFHGDVGQKPQARYIHFEQ